MFHKTPPNLKEMGSKNLLILQVAPPKFKNIKIQINNKKQMFPENSFL